jgi:hypothetical protein
MFLYYVISRDKDAVQKILSSERTQNQLRLKYNRTTISVLDIYAAELEYESKSDKAPSMLPNLAKLRKWFEDFELWFNYIEMAKVPQIGTNSATKIALFIAAATEVWKHPNRITEKQWQQIQVLLTQDPSRIEEVIGIAYPSTRGKWPGQKNQIERTVEICQKIDKR